MEKLKNIKKHIRIPLKDLAKPIDVSHEMTKAGIAREYVYTIGTDSKIIKYGISTRGHSKTLGERLYRQLGNIPGWSEPLVGGNGSEMRDIISDFNKMYGVNITKDDVYVQVCDTIGKTHEERADHCSELEKELIEHSVQHDADAKPPVGNKCVFSRLAEKRELNVRKLRQFSS